MVPSGKLKGLLGWRRGAAYRLARNLAIAAAFVSVFLHAPADAASPVRIVVLGDSLTAGYGLAATDAFPVRLGQALKARGYHVELINAGVSGDTTAGGLARLDWALADAPDIVIVELGANDGLRGLDPASTYANLDAILSRLRSKDVKVLLTGMYAPPNFGREFGAAFDAIFPRLARKHGVGFYPFFLAGVAARPDLNQRDGIHPNARGVAVIVDRITPYVVRLLDQTGQ